MKHRFVADTSNAARFLAGVQTLLERGAAEACLMVVDGVPGLGKSETVEWWTVQNGGALIRAKAEWRPTWLMRELIQALDPNLVPPHSFEKMYRLALGLLGRRADAARLEGRTFAVVVDEVDHICRDRRCLETLRDLSDMLEIPFVLVGMGYVRDALTKYPQIASRVAVYVEFRAASREDTAALLKGLCDCEVAEDLTTYLHQVARGRVREIKEAIRHIERQGLRNKGKPVGIAEMRGHVLLNDRETGRPIEVRE